MKNTNRKAMGLELFFSAQSATFSGLNEYTPGDVRSLVCDSSILVRYPLAQVIYEASTAFLALKPAPSDLMPEDIVRHISHGSVRKCCSEKFILQFMDWIMELARKNETDRVERISSLNSVASAFDSQTASFIRNGFSLNNQRVLFSGDGDSITVSYAERDWGRVCVRFDGCTLPENHPSLPMPGYAFSSEAERLPDGRFEFRFLVDTCFSSIEYNNRLMQDHGWHEIVFTCDSVTADVTLCDYAGRLSRLGTPRAELIDRVGAVLINKHNLLGNDGLSSAEASLLPVAQLLAGSGGLVTGEKSQSWRDEQMILDALDNRYAMQQFGQLLKDSKCGELAERFDLSKNARFDDDEKTALKNVRLFAYMYEHQLAEGSSRCLISRLADRFCGMTSDFTGTNPRCTAEASVTEQILSVVEPQLTAMKFEGTYPHYRRKKRRRTEYLSFMVLPAAEISRHGVFPFYVSLAAARVTSRRLDELKEQGVNPEETNALDCQPEYHSHCRYGELASADDGEYVRVDADLFSRSSSPSPVNNLPRLKNDLPHLKRYIRIADRQFRFGHLPVIYSLSRLFRSKTPSPLPRLFLSTLPLCLVAALIALIGYIVFSGQLGLTAPTPSQAFLGASGLCLGLNTVITLVRRLGIARKLWRYRQ